jgi:hypothetical protein
MSKINLIHNTPLIEDIFNYDVIIIGTGIHNALGNGFQYDMKINFPIIEETVKKTKYADPRKLGSVSVINMKPIVCIGFIHKGGYRSDLKSDYLDYDALKEVVELINDHFKGKRIATTLIGCSQYDGNGNIQRVLSLFEGLSDENEYFLYDYEQRDYRVVNNEKWATINNLVGKIPYKELRKLKDEFIKIRKYGIYGAKNIN